MSCAPGATCHSGQAGERPLQQLAESRLVLAPGEAADVAVLVHGETGSPVAVSLTGTARVPDGAQRGEVALESLLYTERPMDWTPWVVGGALALLAVLAVSIATALLLRRRRRELDERARWVARIEERAYGR